MGEGLGIHKLNTFNPLGLWLCRLERNDAAMECFFFFFLIVISFIDIKKGAPYYTWSVQGVNNSCTKITRIKEIKKKKGMIGFA